MAKSIFRYVNLCKSIRNWPDYLRYKVTGQGPEKFYFITRSAGLEVEVPKSVLSEFKEIFMSQVYMKGFSAPSAQVKNILDIGANVGFFSLFAKSRFPGARVIAYEPVPFNFNFLERQAARNEKAGIVCHQKAVAGKNGEIQIFMDRDAHITTSAGVDATSERQVPVSVRAVTLAEALDENGMETCDFLKMDCEAAEFEILYNSTPETLSRVRHMAIEVHESETPGHSAEALSGFLTKHGFHVDREGRGALSILRAHKCGHAH